MTGLSLGLAASILLTVFIQFELSFDRHFSHGDRIYRMNSIWIDNGEPSEMPINLRSAYTEIPEKVAGVESAIQIYRGFESEVIVGENRHKELDLLYADSDFFRLFDLPMHTGEGLGALNDPGSVVLTAKAADRIFGSSNCIGESFQMENQYFSVSAVCRDIPPNTHFNFDMLMPMEAIPDLENFGGLEFFTYYLLEEQADQKQVIQSLAQENTHMLGERFAEFEGSTFDTRLDALTDLHLHGRVSWDLTTPGSMKTIWIMVVITLAIMGLALTNFINLYILNGAKRSKEIGIRKVNGAGRKSMIRQFYMETTLVVSIAFVAGVFLASMLLPAFARMMQRETFQEVTSTPALYLVLVLIYLFTILLSGFYPALLLSRADPIPLIQGRINPAGDKRILLRVVSVLQILITVSLLTILLGIHTQIRFLKNSDPGYKPEGILMVYNMNEKLSSNYLALRDQLLQQSGIEEVAASSHTIGSGTSGQGIRLLSDNAEQIRGISEYRIWPGICQLYKLRLVAGRFLDPERTPDRKGVLLNEAGVNLLGIDPLQIIGEQVLMHSEPLEVIGVVEDFHFRSAALEIEPLVLTAYSKDIWHIAIRFSEGSDPQEIRQAVNQTFLSFDSEYVMVNRFAIDNIEGYYRSEERLQKILLYASFLSVLIVLLGIYALVSQNMVSRTKEIGIRKVMGGTTQEMMTLIYTSTLKWTLIASVLAVPLSLLYLRQWLSDYAVRIPIYWWIFACSIVVVVLFQSLITLGQTRRTARRNPVEALRYE